MSDEPKPKASDTDRLLQMSLLLKAIDDANQELTEYKAGHKLRIKTLQGDLFRLRWEILSGQERLPLEPIPPSAIVPVMEKVVEQVNAGALNTPGVTVTAEMHDAPDAESSMEEKARTRKTKKKLQGEDALLPAVPKSESESDTKGFQ
jgi:hypothetical protein